MEAYSQVRQAWEYELVRRSTMEHAKMESFYLQMEKKLLCQWSKL